MLRRTFATMFSGAIIVASTFNALSADAMVKPTHLKLKASIESFTRKQWAGHKIQNIKIDSIQTIGDVKFVMVSYLQDEKHVFSMEVGAIHGGKFMPYGGTTSLPHIPGQKVSPIDQMELGGSIGGKVYFMQGGYVNDNAVTVVTIAFNDGVVKTLPVPPDHLFAYGSLTATGLRQLTGYDRHGHIVWTMK